ncbi:MAG TPA: hypothetical protein VFV33_01215, partial [Gemmatimonadaceae bacterium]|nr:hypothetical protein [Gemmatimonadaceae bacterium]
MNVSFGSRIAPIALLLVALAPAALAQEQPGPRTDTAVARLVVEPTSLSLKAGEMAPITVKAYDAAGNELKAARVRLSGPRASLAVGQGQVKALRAGRYEIVATAQSARSDQPVIVRIPVAVTWPAITRVAISAEPGRLYSGV